MLSVIETAWYLSLSKSWLDKKRLSGGGPPYLKLGRRVVYDVADLDAWAASNKRQTTSEAGST
jgi:predicted DNA-binding transcriptional regulator AlpA